MRVYLSGPMTGYFNLNFDEFHRHAKELRAKGFDVVNPAEINPDLNADWLDCIKEDIEAMRHCNAIFMMDGWNQSYGACIEHMVAQKLKMEIMYEGELVSLKENLN